MPTGAGQRNARVRFERRTSVSDGMGNTKGPWAALCGPYWARLTPLKGGETVLQQRLAGSAPYQVTLLSNAAVAGVTVADRMVLVRAPGLAAGMTFDINDASPDERNVEITLLVKAGAASG